MKLPQLRLITVDFCDSKCVYCRPSGEAAFRDKCIHKLSLDTAIRIAKIYKEHGGDDIKITGGDPIFWNDLPECIRILKNEVKIKTVGIVTRTIKILDVLDELIDSGLDSIIFSLDTLDEEKYKKITGKNDFKEYIDVIKYCAKKTYCKINTVVMKDINNDEIDKMIEFCLNNNIRQLKFLDLISDLHESKVSNSGRLNDNYNANLQDLYINFEQKSKYLDLVKPKTLLQEGGLGHPQKLYKIAQLNVVLKDATNGAWYGKCCEDCKWYPCHDALMAIRLLPNNSFQLCLLNEDKVYKFDESNEKMVFEECLDFYKNAKFRKQ